MSELTEPEKKILEAAKKVFELQGYAGARMQQIADEAGISKASLHYYFRSKENLFERIFDETMSDFMELVSTWNDDSEHWEDKLKSFILGFFNFLKTKSLLFILGEINRNPDLLLSRRKKSKPKAKFITYFENLQATGKMKPSNMYVVYIFMHSLCAYPLLNARMFQMTTGMNNQDYEAFMNKYPDTVADLLINALKKGLN
ncbi:MAG: TetR/AcrR family transcriptional regulator [Bacteroidota bacterium]